jgi:hypothetical protein
MGTCIPSQLLDYLSRKQKSIDSLAFVTDGACANNSGGLCAIDLSAFLRLRKLSWKGLRSESNMETLKATLGRVSQQLLELELDFINKEELQSALLLDDYQLDNFFTHRILELSFGSTTQLFPTVTVLSLSNIPFGSDAQDMAHVFDWGLLRSLTLRFCDGWEDFLLRGIKLSCPSKLRSLELQSTLNEEIDAEGSIAEFLGSFQGLEQVAISHGSPSFTRDIWDALVHHKSTLRTFVHHQRGLHDDSDSEDFEEVDTDSADLSLSERDVIEWSKDGAVHPLSGLDLEFLGLCCVPDVLMVLVHPQFISHRVLTLLQTYVLDALTARQSLRILHVRQSGADIRRSGSWGELHPYENTASEPDSPASGESAQNLGPILTKPLRNLAQWAFGPEGLLSLQVIAFGDFSYEGRYANSQVLLVRNTAESDSRHGTKEHTFRRIRLTDQWQNDLISRYSQMLAACPTSPLLED